MNDQTLDRAKQIKQAQGEIIEALETIDKILGSAENRAGNFKRGTYRDGIKVIFVLSNWSPRVKFSKDELAMLLTIKRGFLATELDMLQKEYDAL